MARPTTSVRVNLAPASRARRTEVSDTMTMASPVASGSNCIQT